MFQLKRHTFKFAHSPTIKYNVKLDAHLFGRRVKRAKKRKKSMSFEFIKKLPTPDEIRAEYPVPEKVRQIKVQRDAEIRKVFTGESDKFLVIIGPCSADNEEAVCDYVCRLARVNEQVKDKLILVPRIYTNKPRTTGDGYKGIVHQPDPEKGVDFVAGLIAMRHMQIRAVEETGLTAADEMLYPENWRYVSDILSYVAIGARSVEDQQHRLTVSGFDVPAGMKNPTSGDFSVMMNSIYAAQHAHSFIYRGWEVKTTGNPAAHAVLRGATNKHGNNTPNYHYEDLVRVLDMYNKMDLKNPAVVIDANHSNSDKQFKQQIRIVKEVMHNRTINPDIRNLVKGVMIESYIEEGNQKIGEGVYGKSITDPCLGWEDSERLIHDIADLVI
ncbi:MAG: 3-deoxy-7-phosphoheptulonate synthase [Lachnospiraceae bacterium]|nr:3-deoxy-7-phosphoheptulonate synthase [Lachnospiraceae bacterium]